MSGWSVAYLFVAAALAPWMSGDEHNSALEQLYAGRIHRGT